MVDKLDRTAAMTSLMASYWTGFGEAHLQQDGLGIAAEVRTINGRYFKLSVRTTDGSRRFVMRSSRGDRIWTNARLSSPTLIRSLRLHFW